jgi:hypothetical protein
MNTNIKLQQATEAYLRRCKCLSLIHEQPSNACCKIVGNVVTFRNGYAELGRYQLNPKTGFFR